MCDLLPILRWIWDLIHGPMLICCCWCWFRWTVKNDDEYVDDREKAIGHGTQFDWWHLKQDFTENDSLATSLIVISLSLLTKPIPISIREIRNFICWSIFENWVLGNLISWRKMAHPICWRWDNESLEGKWKYTFKINRGLFEEAGPLDTTASHDGYKETQASMVAQDSWWRTAANNSDAQIQRFDLDANVARNDGRAISECPRVVLLTSSL